MKKFSIKKVLANVFFKVSRIKKIIRLQSQDLKALAGVLKKKLFLANTKELPKNKKNGNDLFHSLM